MIYFGGFSNVKLNKLYAYVVVTVMEIITFHVLEIGRHSVHV
jgi:hypothetical protein